MRGGEGTEAVASSGRTNHKSSFFSIVEGGGFRSGKDSGRGERAGGGE